MQFGVYACAVFLLCRIAVWIGLLLFIDFLCCAICKVLDLRQLRTRLPEVILRISFDVNLSENVRFVGAIDPCGIRKDSLCAWPITRRKPREQRCCCRNYTP